MSRDEKEKADKIIRTAHKAALRLPQSTSTEKLLALGLHNTFEELAEAQLTTQVNRLLQTPTGRALLQRIGLGEQVQAHRRTRELSCLLKDWYKVSPLPKNMDPTLHAGRRKARAAYIDKKTKYMNTARFTDAAPYQSNAKNMVAVVTDRKGKVTSCASIAQASITEAEEVASALAIKEGRERKAPLTIITDSKATCRNYQRGRIVQSFKKTGISNALDSTEDDMVLDSGSEDDVEAGGEAAISNISLDSDSQASTLAMSDGSLKGMVAVPE
ncbi:hypothetical protein HPB50_007241 [Hyalomma asiaticum]|uniref:Uncharacterized protein n=1 Tax=Hyalomma asiaticum TaxID=266040 RepID=A0ACB7RJR7_HYAAI|nr:hypothetical protein HPB50_007241 [Hyalomma asiaticum]